MYFDVMMPALSMNGCTNRDTKVDLVEGWVGFYIGHVRALAVCFRRKHQRTKRRAEIGEVELFSREYEDKR